jgi:hypothetical protein
MAAAAAAAAVAGGQTAVGGNHGAVGAAAEGQPQQVIFYKISFTVLGLKWKKIH